MVSITQLILNRVTVNASSVVTIKCANSVVFPNTLVFVIELFHLSECLDACWAQLRMCIE